jgi:hypothetical protein
MRWRSMTLYDPNNRLTIQAAAVNAMLMATAAHPEA